MSLAVAVVMTLPLAVRSDDDQRDNDRGGQIKIVSAVPDLSREPHTLTIKSRMGYHWGASSPARPGRAAGSPAG